MRNKGVNFKLSATNAAGPAFNSFRRGMDGVKASANAAKQPMRSWNAGLNANRRAVQQFGFQMSDFAIQVSGGQSAMLAFIQQGGQMLQFFGPAGAVLAALVAVFGSLYLGVTRAGVAMDQLYPYLGVLEQEFRIIVDTVSTVINAFGNMARFLVNNLDTIIIAVAIAVGWVATKWVAGVISATITTGAFSNVLRATALSYYAAGSGAAAATLATSALTAAMNILRVALLRLGLPALVIAAAYLIERFITLQRGAGSFGEAMKLLGAVAYEVFRGMGRVGQGFFTIMWGVAQGVASVYLRAFGQIAKAWDALVNGMALAWNTLADTQLGESMGMRAMEFSNVSATLTQSAIDLQNKAVENIKSGGNIIKTSMNGVADAWARPKAVLATGEVEMPDIDFSGAGDDGGGGGGGKSPVQKAQDAADKIKEIFEDMQKSISGSMLSGFKALLNGSKSFADYALDVLNTISDKVIDLLMAPIFDSVAGSISRTILGGIGGGFGGIPSFDGGGSTWSGPRAGGLDGKGGRLALLHSDEDVIDRRKGGGGNTHVTVGVDVDASGNLMPFVVSVVQAGQMQQDKTLRGKVNAINASNDQRFR